MYSRTNADGHDDGVADHDGVTHSHGDADGLSLAHGDGDAHGDPHAAFHHADDNGHADSNSDAIADTHGDADAHADACAAVACTSCRAPSSPCSRATSPPLLTRAG